METTVPIAIGLAALSLLVLGALVDDRRARVRRRAQHGEPYLAVPLLHSINEDRCIGCEACIDVCPTQVLDLVGHKVKVARFSDCVQCEQCANSCPTQALVMYRQGTTPRMLTVPELDETFQTGVPGQYLIGEVAGKPLVKNAANLGRAVVEHIARTLAGPAPAGVLDVAIVGSGPGGLSAGLTCLKHKLSCIVLEKEHVVASTVSRYPKGKHFMAEPCTSQNVSYLPVFDGTKEQLIDAWKTVIDAVRMPIKLGEAVDTVVRGDDGVFSIKTTVATYRARTVVLATGLRGKPRLLAVPGANLEKVQPLLDDPAEFAGQHVLVVGGGDSAVEGAMALAEVGANVALSYRGDGFKRCKQGNQKRLAEMTAAGQLSVLLESNVKEFTAGGVTLKLADGSETTLANQQAFVLIGADTPIAWLETNNVRFVERPHLYTLGSSEDVVRRFAPGAAACPHTPAEAIAIVLDRPVPGSRARRVRTVAQHLRDEFRGVVTSVSGVFHLPELEPPLIPVSRLAAGPGPIRPRSPQRRVTTTEAMPSLRSLERASGLPGRLRAPSNADARTEEVVSLRALERLADPDTAATEQVPALRALEHAIELATEETPSLRARAHAVQVVTPALRTPSTATGVELAPSLALEHERPVLHRTLRSATAMAEHEGPVLHRTLRSATAMADAYEDPDGPRGVASSPPRSGAPPIPRAPRPSSFARLGSPDAAVPRQQPRPQAVPPPVPPAARFPRGSKGPTHAAPPTPSEPQTDDAAGGPARGPSRSRLER